MKRISLLVTGGIAAMLLGSFAACGSPESTFPEPDANGSNGGIGASSGGGIGTSSGEGSSGNYEPFDPEKCATYSQEGKLLPVELMLVFDLSSSMCYVAAEKQFLCDDDRSRWPATTNALRTFLTSQESAGLSMAVRTFGPVDNYRPQNTVATNRCSPSQYEQPTYTAQDLPNQALADQVLGLKPDTSDPNATMTQTAAALGGAATYCKNRTAELNGDKRVSILLLTDGDPTGCTSNPISEGDKDVSNAVEAARAARAQGTLVYVLNIGGKVDNLNAIAAAGGTNQAINVDGTNSQAISDALNKVRGEALSCNFQVPVPERGEPDPEQLNIFWKPDPEGDKQLIFRSADCSDGRGWKYDNPETPTTVTLCPTLCNEVLASEVGKLDVVLGCATRGSPPS